MATLRITWDNNKCFEASVSDSNIWYTETAFEELIKNCAKIIEASLKDKK